MEQSVGNKKKLVWALKMTIRWILIIISALIVVGFIYETVSYQNVQKNFPPYGKMMEINGGKLHVHVQGALKDNQ